MPPSRGVRPLTDAQRRLCEENLGLIGGAVDAFPQLWPSGDREEANAVVTQAFIRAARAYEPSRGRFSTLVYTCARRALWNAKNRGIRGERSASQYRREVVRRRAAWTAPEPVRDPAGAAWVELLDERTRLVAQLRANGLTLEEIGAQLGITKQWVSQILSEAREWVTAYRDDRRESRM